MQSVWGWSNCIAQILCRTPCYHKALAILTAREITAVIGRLIIGALTLSVFAAQQSALAAPYEDADWTRSAGNLNISLYAFRDQNRNGVYDVGDLPMAGVVVELGKPDGSIVQTSSNINGYANFKMAMNSDKHPVTEAGGLYQFEVLPPPGWKVSSGNTVQESRFLAKKGSVAGIVAEHAPNWVGLVQDLEIRGRVVGPGEAPLPGDVAVTLVAADGETRALDLAANGGFSSAVDAGDYQLEFSSASLNWTLQRDIHMANDPVELVTIEAGAPHPEPQPKAVLETFDWLNRSIIEKIPNKHDGLNWDYLLAVHNQQYNGPGYVNGLTSGHAVAYNSSGHPVTISALEGEVFDFVGGYFSVAWNNAQGEILDVTAWRGDQRVAIHELKLSYLGPVWLDADLRGIDKLTLSSRHYWQFVADDLRFRVSGSALTGSKAD
jgi:hypothetical protein